jgi:hypothetical protein
MPKARTRRLEKLVGTNFEKTEGTALTLAVSGPLN